MIRREKGISHTSESNIIKVRRSLDGLYFATHIKVFYLTSEVSDGRVSRVVSTEHLYSLLHAVWTVYVLDLRIGLASGKTLRTCCITHQ
jgi:hypothetical protein